jgi:SsrA-binding protein
MNVLIINKRAKFEYHILESFQAGLLLSGELTKAIKEKRVIINSAYVVYHRNGLNMIGLKYKDVDYTIPLLLYKKEMNEILGTIKQKNFSCVPISIRRVGRWFKAEIAIVKGKKLYDKKETIKQRDLDREQARTEKY